MKQLMAAVVISATAALALPGQVLAHGAVAKHGGAVASANDLAFELVAKDGKAVIYIDDHGHALSTQDAKGTLTVLQGKKKSQTTLAAGEDDTLVSQDDVKLGKGSKAVASITLPGKEPISVRFAVK